MITSGARKHRNEYLSFYSKFAVKTIFFLLFLVILSSLVSKCKTYFPIKSVRIFGIHHADQHLIEQALTPLVNKGFFAIDVENIKDRLLQSPWVAKAVVQRIWPDKVLITLVEKKPIARWNNSSLLSTAGEIFSPDVSSYPEHLPHFIGPEGQQIQMLQYYKKISGIFMPLHFKIARFQLTPELSWDIAFDNGIKLTVGSKDVLTRVSHFVKVYPKIIGNRIAEVDHVDLRYSNGLAVRWKTATL